MEWCEPDDDFCERDAVAGCHYGGGYRDGGHYSGDGVQPDAWRGEFQCADIHNQLRRIRCHDHFAGAIDCVAGGAAFTLTVNGAGFVSGAAVKWNGANRTTTFVSATQLQAAITAADIATAGTTQVTVFNPTPGGGNSNAVSFTISASNPVPTITSISPSSVVAGNAAFTLTVNGMGFVSGAALKWNGASRTTTFVSATQLQAAITAADIATAGTAQVTVFNSTPGGGTSNAIIFTISAQTSTLAAAYAFNEGSGTTTADASANGNTGQIKGAAWTSKGMHGKALSFDGNSDYVDLGPAPNLLSTGSMTWSAWVYPSGNVFSDGQIVARSDNTSGWQLKVTPDTGRRTFGVAISANGNHTQRYSRTVFSQNTWYYVAGVYNAAARTLDIYVNGVLDDGALSGTVPSSQTVSSHLNPTVGKRSGGYYFKGTIDDLRVYNRALSAVEIQADMNTAVTPVAPLPANRTLRRRRVRWHWSTPPASRCLPLQHRSRSYRRSHAHHEASLRAAKLSAN